MAIEEMDAPTKSGSKAKGGPKGSTFDLAAAAVTKLAPQIKAALEKGKTFKCDREDLGLPAKHKDGTRDVSPLNQDVLIKDGKFYNTVTFRNSKQPAPFGPMAIVRQLCAAGITNAIVRFEKTYNAQVGSKSFSMKVYKGDAEYVKELSELS